MKSGPLTTPERLAAAAEVWRCQEVLQKLDVLVWEADGESLRTGYISGRAEKMLGYPAERWLDEVGFFPRIVHPSDQDLARQLIEDVRRDGEDRQTELRLVHSDGRELWFQFQLYPADHHRPLRVLRGLFVNISEHRAASAQLNVFLESAPDAIVVVDVEGRIVKVNRLTEVMFGFNRTELLGNRVEMLVPQRYRHSHVRHREQYSAHPQTRPMGMGRSLTGLKKDGSEFPIEISLSPFQDDQGSLVISIIRDITERRRAEELIQASLREKEVLLKEIHHRVKNNLQITSSLLKLQSGYIQDARAREMFADSQNRIRSMALVHEKLYQTSDLSRIHFADYIGSLAALLCRTYGVNQHLIRLHFGGEGIFLSVETAVPCGLIVNELLSNCLKHAFPGDRPGEVWIQLDPLADGQLQLTVADDGVGLPEGLDLLQIETLGLQLVRTLAQQLDGAVEVLRSPRTEFRIIFPDSRPETSPAP